MGLPQIGSITYDVSLDTTNTYTETDPNFSVVHTLIRLAARPQPAAACGNSRSTNCPLAGKKPVKVWESVRK
jgi:hypothetical protein